MTQYRLYLQRHVNLLIFGVFGIMTIFGLLLLVGVFQSSDDDAPPRLFGIFWLTILGWNWYFILSIPHTITLSESGQIEFISVLRRKQISARDILSIKLMDNFVS